MAMNKKDIEGAAVSAVKEKIRLCPMLSENIFENDKTPSIDGCIFIHENAKQTKKNMKMVNVQVKGCEKNDFEKDTISFPVDIEDLKNYKANGGCIFFGVYVRQYPTKIENKVYYQELTPVKIFNILANTKAKVKPTISLKSLPEQPDDIASIVLNCYEHCRMQESFVKEGVLPRLDTLEKKRLIDGIKIPFFGYGKTPKYPAELNYHDVYMYVKLKDSDVWLPLQTQPEHITDKCVIQKPVTVNGNKHYSEYTIAHDGNSTTITIGNSFTISKKEGVPGCKMKYEASKMLRTLYKDSGFVLAVIENNGFEIGGIPFEFNSAEIDLRHFKIESQIKNRQIMEQYIKMLDQQGCFDDVDISKLKAKDYKALDALVTSTCEHKAVSGLPQDMPPIVKLSVGDLQFALWFQQTKNDKNTYMIYNAMEYSKPLYTKFCDKKDLEVPVSIIFSEDDYIHISNILFDKILPSFERFSATPYIYDVSNMVMLKMLCAHDKATGERKERLFDTVKAFSCWLESMPANVWDSRISVLNRLQIDKRCRLLSDAEKDDIRSIMAKSSGDYHIMVGANILLDHFEDADYWYKKMKKEDQNNFRTLPIFNLWRGKKQ